MQCIGHGLRTIIGGWSHQERMLLSIRYRCNAQILQVRSKQIIRCNSRSLGTTSGPLATHTIDAGKPARTRFAPSPTGYLHLGSLRTALFNYLVAKHSKGAFILRIEDTDQKRTVPDAEQKIIEYLRWAGINWDEGPDIGGPYGPYRQSLRLAIYENHVQQLLSTSKAYRCFCTPERIASLATGFDAHLASRVYDRKCIEIPPSESQARAARKEPHVVRFRLPERLPGFRDVVYGNFRSGQVLTSEYRGKGVFQDPIIVKSDGYPTYHLANVVDDHLMRITHVIRGSEWLPSTPMHVALYDAFGWTPPSFAHVSLLVNKDNQKLSKRDGSMDLSAYRYEQGVFPETMINFVALLGWSHRERSDVMDMDALIKNASLKYTKSNAIVALEKLEFLQKRHAARYAMHPEGSTARANDIANLAIEPMLTIMQGEDPNPSSQYRDFLHRYEKDTKRRDALEALFKADASNYVSPRQFLHRNQYIFKAPPEAAYENALQNRSVLSEGNPEIQATLAKCVGTIREVQPWSHDGLASAIRQIIDDSSPESEAPPAAASKREVTTRVYRALRWALVAGAEGPTTTEVMRLLGSEESVRRLEEGVRILQAQA